MRVYYSRNSLLPTVTCKIGFRFFAFEKFSAYGLPVKKSLICSFLFILFQQMAYLTYIHGCPSVFCVIPHCCLLVNLVRSSSGSTLDLPCSLFCRPASAPHSGSLRPVFGQIMLLH